MNATVTAVTPRPLLHAEHSPGWTNETTGDGVTVLFSSVQPDFGWQFETDRMESGDLSACLCPDTGARRLFSEEITPDMLADLGNACDRLQAWLDDCAEALAWLQAREREAGN
ncbi:hypothetical protein [Bifidobacterium avesanii]|uniref:Uncharacterized protein n=1 Tax=Bifidobacterium avesanii TaxID=1798157 RepID=A0A7K3THE2_9BIFI|nr:hypothetical protein [Bifidobacterium avesanii]KAB8294525.1 hypothetical protein DSM100685_0318 [Bifidobacterium avesanii]NEG78040.1 hypothetical protein [Bifidobacterium avesanii]